MPSTRVLVVDKDRDRASQVAAKARSDGWEVALAPSLDAAREAMADGSPLALALADATVWANDDFRRFVSTHQPRLPIVVLTGGDESRDGLIAQLNLGAMSYIPHNAESRRLVETIRTIIALTARSPYRERIREFLRAGEIELHLGNDPAIIPTVVGYIHRIIEDYDLTSEREQTRLGIGLGEALSNAMIHGNLDISSGARARLDDSYYDLIATRRAREPWASRRVHLIMRFSQSLATFVIRDQGKGFNPAAIADPTAQENLLVPSGRGLLLMRAYCTSVSWNDIGNEVTLTKVLRPDAAAAPA